MPKGPEVVDAPKEPAWIPPTVRLNTEDAEKLLAGNLPGLDQIVEFTAKVTGIEQGNERDYESGKAKPRKSVTLEIQSVETDEEPEMEGVMSDEDEEATLGYKRPKKDMNEAPMGGAVY